MTNASDWPKAVLFDLDGTLIDSVPDIHDALNELMHEEGQGTFSVPEVVRMIGGGVRKLVERAYAAHGEALPPGGLERLTARYVELYAPRATRLTTLLPGARETLARLRGQGRTLGVVTNKPSAETREILRHFGLEDVLHVVVGGDAGPPVKPEPGLLLLAAERLGLDPSDCLFVGDSENDVGAAKAAGIRVVVLAGGYTVHPAEDLGADLVVARLDEIADRMAALSDR